VLLSEILHTLTNDEIERKRYLADRQKFVHRIDGLSHEEKNALVELNQIKFIQLGVHPFVSHALRRVLERAGILEPDGETS
jgi:hypothetical protein